MEGGSCELWLIGKKKGDENNCLCWDLILLQGKYKKVDRSIRGTTVSPAWQKPGGPARTSGGFLTQLSGNLAFLTVVPRSISGAGFCQRW